MIDIDTTSDEIHTDYFSNEFSEFTHSLRQGFQWGVYHEKPVCQVKWEHSLAKAIASLADDAISESSTSSKSSKSASPPRVDFRPHITDQLSGMSLLIDTGASASIWPRSNTNQGSTSPPLKAVNGTTIRTFGQNHRTVLLNNRHFTHKFIIADIQTPIIGWDFLAKFHLDLRWRGDKCTLVGNKMRAQLSLEGVQTHLFSLSATTDLLADVPATYRALIQKYPQVLKPTFQKSPTHGIVHHIETGDAPPCHAKVRPIMPGSPKELGGKAALQELEQLGVIERVNPQDSNLWTTALHLVKKPDGSYRATGDYRPLNDKTHLCGYPLPNIQNFVGNLTGSSVFSKLDMIKAFYNIELSPESSKKTTMVTPWGAFQYRRLAMGLRNSAQSYQRWMDHIFRDIPGVFVYIDDILVHSRNHTEHEKIMDQVFKKLQENGLAISLPKCKFAANQVDFLGWTITSAGIKPIKKKLDAISRFPQPAKPKELLAFLGALNYYRKSLPRINNKSPAAILQPLYKAATDKTPGIKFMDVCKSANLAENYAEAKMMLSEAVQLNHPNPSAPLAITTDASLTCIGAVLEQYVNNAWTPLGFWSKTLKPNQTRWSTFKRELFAIHQGLRHFLPDFEGRPITVFCDHKPILGAFKSPSSMDYDPIARNQMVEIGFHTTDIKFVEGKSNFVADWLSRPPTGTAHDLSPDFVQTIAPDVQMPTINAIYAHTIDPVKMAADQDLCPQVAAHLQGHHPPAIRLQKCPFLNADLWCDTSTGQPRPLVPDVDNWRQKIFETFHNVRHLGKKATAKLISDRYYWPDLRPQVANMVQSCPDCQAVHKSVAIKPPMKPNPVTQPRFSELQLDIVGPMPVSEGHRYLFTIYDRTTRWISAVPMIEASATSCVNAFIRGWIQNFGLPKSLHSDNGTSFTSNLWKNFQSSFGLVVSYSPHYRPQAAGGVERQHKEIKSALKTALHRIGDTHGSRWMEVLPWTLLGRHTTFQPDINAAPSDLVFGGSLRIPGDLLTNAESVPIPELLDKIRRNVAKAPVTPVHHQTTPVRLPANLDSTTHVYVLDGKPSPLGPTYQGPFEIVEHLGDSCLKLRVGTLVNGTPRYEVQHWTRCKPAHGDITPAQRPQRGRKPSPSLKVMKTPKRVNDLSIRPTPQTPKGITTTRVLRSSMRPIGPMSYADAVKS